MAHPETEAVDAPASYDEASAAAAIADILPDEETGEEEPEPDPSPVEEGDDIEGEEEQVEEADEPETAIEAPVSLNAEEKAVFAQLPAEAQEAWAASETRRNAQVQEATTKAASAQREAEAKAAQANETAKLHYAAQLKAIGEKIAPLAPDPSQYRDQLQYLTDMELHRQDLAQHQTWMQQVSTLEVEAKTGLQEIDQRARAADLMTVPELANPETRETHIAWARELATDIGVDPDFFEKTADSVDFKNLKKVGEWRDKAGKYDKAVSRQMQKVRSGKEKSLRPGAAQPNGSDQRRALADATQRLRNTGSVDDAAAALRALL